MHRSEVEYRHGSTPACVKSRHCHLISCVAVGSESTHHKSQVPQLQTKDHNVTHRVDVGITIAVKCSQFPIFVEVLAGTAGTLHGEIEESTEGALAKVWEELKETKDGEAPQG